MSRESDAEYSDQVYRILERNFIEACWSYAGHEKITLKSLVFFSRRRLFFGMSKSSDGVRLSGNTLRVYTFIFKSKKSSIKAVQVALHLNSPALAQYHLEKLVSLGLAKRDEITGEYMLMKEVKVETLAHFLKVGSYIVPRFLLYTVMLSFVFTYFSIFVAHLVLNGYTLWTFLIGGFAIIVMWYETIKAWRNFP